MMDKRLLALVPEAMRHVVCAVAWKWAGLVANICLALGVAQLLADVLAGVAPDVALGAFLIALACVGKLVSTRGMEHESFRASQDVKRKLRRTILEKLLRLGQGFDRVVSTAEAVQLSVEGCEQLETYFGQYLPQLFYAVLAPVTLFVVVAPMDLAAALVLLLFVPLIPLAIVAVQKIAKRILSQHWDQYTQLGDFFLENLQGLTTLKIYQADAAKHAEMNKEAEHFRIVTMEVLSMQLNSIIVMDIVALGGAAAGIAVALASLAAGHITLFEALLVVLLSADFFLPMRQLGSYFHVAMNGIAASGKIFHLLELPESEERRGVPEAGSVPTFEHVSFSYDGERCVLEGVSLDVAPKGVTAIVGISGLGKSMLCRLLMRFWDVDAGAIRIGDADIREIRTGHLRDMESFVEQDTVLFHESIRQNLLIAKPDAMDAELAEACRKASVLGFIRSLPQGFDTMVGELGDTLSGGGRQRLGLAPAFLPETPFILLDEPTSILDALNEGAVLKALDEQRGTRMVILISHRPSTVTIADRTIALDQGRVSQARISIRSTTYESKVQACGA